MKKLKSVESERLPTSMTEVDDTDDMMICENSPLKENDTQQTDNTTNTTQPVIIPKHCNGICKYVF